MVILLIMPIIEKEIEWLETEDSVSIKVAVRGVNKKNASILSSSRYLKLSCPPLFWEAFLKDSVNTKSTIIRIGDNSVVFLLTKQRKQIWNELSDSRSDDKSYCQKMRMDALSEIQADAKEERKQRQIQKSERDKAAVQLQMSLESEERKRIDDIKENERKKVASEIENWQFSHTTRKEPEKAEILNTKQITDDRDKTIKTSVKQFEEPHKKMNESKPVIKSHMKETLESHPLPRASGHITVSFSPREFPTAARESKKEEEDEWLQKQAMARKHIELQCSDLRPDEKNPVWLKDKGDDFYSKGDYLAAINAYNLAIRMCPKLPSLYANRAACHLKCRNLHKTIEDTSEALALLTPPVEANAGMRLKCHIRRGTAFCQLELYYEGLQDYEAALKIDPHHSGVQEDAKKIRNIIQSTNS